MPDKREIAECSAWLRREFEILRPQLVIPVGKLAISQFLPDTGKLIEIIGQKRRIEFAGVTCDIVPLPHPSGASTWPRSDPGKRLTSEALQLVAEHPAFAAAIS